MEMSYFEFLNKLYEDIKSDVAMPEHAREDVLNRIEQLEEILFKYSA
jgi:uncharacterized protein (UPF0147 family)